MTPERRGGFVAVLAVGVLALGACSGLKSELGLGKQQGPDEFAVVRRAPLSLPPDYALRPPQPGASRPQEVSQREGARAALLGLSETSGGETLGEQRAVARAPIGADDAGMTPGEQALVAKAQATRTDSSIRAKVNEEAAEYTADSRTFVEKLMFWRERVEPSSVVDPQKEQQRLRQNAALGKPTSGQGVPTIERTGGSEAKGINLF